MAPSRDHGSLAGKTGHYHLAAGGCLDESSAAFCIPICGVERSKDRRNAVLFGSRSWMVLRGSGLGGNVCRPRSSVCDGLWLCDDDLPREERCMEAGVRVVRLCPHVVGALGILRIGISFWRFGVVGS